MAPRPGIGVSAIVFDSAERVLLVRRGQPPAQGFWHPPGGKLEPGEGLVDACRREVREETGLDVSIGPVMAVVERRQEGFHYLIIDFLGFLPDPNATHVVAGDDVVDVAWVAEHELSSLPLTDGLRPILDRARVVHRGGALGLVDHGGAGTDFIPADPMNHC